MEQVFSDDNVRVKDKTKLQFISFDNPEMSKYCLNLSSLFKYDNDNFFFWSFVFCSETSIFEIFYL